MKRFQRRPVANVLFRTARCSDEHGAAESDARCDGRGQPGCADAVGAMQTLEELAIHGDGDAGRKTQAAAISAAMTAMALEEAAQR
ncbi:hypothetical protein [Paraburkholderia sp. MM5384-R2]|uniref:hypothetical protein n=1 Tax=unclassified Paraburkholderia TaxID=2615204 RepID=UPI00161B1747|nr:hypothetical protein [Paraburkholderia sp. MM5384-R2]MBB5501682.1 hypothetical protein [Paraburkholderia sp. MM5384-R2]